MDFSWITNGFRDAIFGEGVTAEQFVSNSVRESVEGEEWYQQLMGGMQFVNNFIKDLFKDVLNWGASGIMNMISPEQDDAVDVALNSLEETTAAAAPGSQDLAALSEIRTAINGGSGTLGMSTAGARNAGMDGLISYMTGSYNPSLRVASAAYNTEFRRYSEQVMNRVFTQLEADPANVDYVRVMRQRFTASMQSEEGWEVWMERYGILENAATSAEYYSGLTRGADGTFDSANNGGIYAAALAGRAIQFYGARAEAPTTIDVSATVSLMRNEIAVTRGIDSAATVFSNDRGLNNEDRAKLEARAAQNVTYTTATLAEGATDTGISAAELDYLSNLSPEQQREVGDFIAANLSFNGNRMEVADIDVNSASGEINITYQTADGSRSVQRDLTPTP